MWNPMRKNLLTALATLLLASFLNSCSDEPKAPAKPSLQPVSLQLEWVTQSEFSSYYVALEKGWYREEGIDLTIKPGGPDVISADLVAAGVSEFGTAGLDDLTKAIDAGRKVVSISQIQQSNGLLLISRKSSGIQNPRDLAGKRVGVWFGSGEGKFNALMAREGVPLQDIKLVSQGWSMDPFLKGDLDVASAMSYNEYNVVLESGVKPEELNVINFADYGLDFPGHCIFTSRKLLAENPDLCVRMLRASLKGWRYVLEHPEEAVDTILKYDKSGVQKREHQLMMMQEVINLVRGHGQPLGKTDEGAVARMAETLNQSGIITKILKPEDIYTSDIWEKASSQR